MLDILKVSKSVFQNANTDSANQTLNSPTSPTKKDQSGMVQTMRKSAYARSRTNSSNSLSGDFPLSIKEKEKPDEVGVSAPVKQLNLEFNIKELDLIIDHVAVHPTTATKEYVPSFILFYH